MLKQGWVFDTAHPMSDTRGMQVFQRTPDALCPKHLSSTHRAGNAVLDRILKRRNMREKWIRCLVSSQVDPYHACPLEALHQFHRGDTLLCTLVPHHTENDARFDAHLLTGLSHRLIHHLHADPRRQSPAEVDEREKEDTRI